jgi:AraC family transcriptional regulator
MAECLGATTGDAEIAPDPPIPDWLERVRERIRDERGNGTRVATLAHDVGVHPVYLTRRFRRAYGCSVVAYVQAERVRHAADQLVRTADAISHVAYDAGFADQSHLTRAFSRAAGVPPAVFRDIATGRSEVQNVQETAARRG